MRIKKRKPIIFIRSSHFPLKPLCNDIYPSLRTPCSRQNASIYHSVHTHFRHGRFYALPPAASAEQSGILLHQSRSNRANRQTKISFQLERLPYLHLAPFGKTVFVVDESTTEALFINVLFLLQTIDDTVYGIIGNAPALQFFCNLRPAMLGSGAICRHSVQSFCFSYFHRSAITYRSLPEISFRIRTFA